MIRRAAMMAALVLASSASAARPAPIYGNVVLSDETNDMAGIELRLHDGASPRIDFVFCEGGCNSVAHIPIIVRRGGFDFTFRETSSYPDGRPGPVTVMRFRAHYWKDRLVLEQQPDGQRHTLRRIRRPYGLFVAELCERDRRAGKHGAC